MCNYIYLGNGMVVSEETLQHHGVKGMKWGVRKKSYASEKAAYKSAKKDLRDANLLYQRSGGIGISGIARAKRREKERNTAELNMIDAKAKYKAAKSKDSAKAEFKTYRKEMQKSGLVGSAADTQSGGRSSRLYDHIKVTKGKAYADRVQQQVQKVAVAQIATGAAVVVGATVVNAMLESRR